MWKWKGSKRTYHYKRHAMRLHWILIATAQEITLTMLGAPVRQQVYSALHYVTVEEERIKNVLCWMTCVALGQMKKIVSK
jgi:hypothetical protein